MDTKALLEWYNTNRDLITVLDAETECGMSRGTLSAAIKGTRGLPSKYIEPLTILMDSLTAGPRQEPKAETQKGNPEQKPVQVFAPAPPMLQRSTNSQQEKPVTVIPPQVTRTEITASGVVVRYRDRYPTHGQKHNGEYKLIKDEGKGKPKTYFNGTCYMRTGNHKPARFAFIQSDLT
jgi:hypothetical protein